MYVIPRLETSPGVRKREDEVSGRGVMLSISLRNWSWPIFRARENHCLSAFILAAKI